MTGVEIKGDKELVKQFEALLRRADGPGMVLVMVAGSAVVAQAVRARTPRATGELHDSIRVVIKDEKNKVLGHIGTDVFYGLFQEKGTRNMAAQPFLRPGLDASAGDARREMAAELKKRVIKP